jgi:hypothetical protein
MEITNSSGSTLITSTGLSTNVVDTAQIVSGAVTANEIQSNSITANEIQSGTLTSASGVFGTISANDITTGTLDANNVNVINLNADNITSGTISADFLNGGSANVNKVFASDSLTASGTVFGTFGDFSVLDTSVVDIDGTRTIDNGSDFVGDDVRCDDLDFDHCYVSRSHFTEILDIRNTSGGTGDHGIRGMAGGSAQYGGLVGEESGFDFYADGSGTNYGPFTGAHDSLLDKTATQPAIGDVLVDVGPVVKKEISTTLCEVAVSTKAGDKAVSGVCAKVQDLRQTNPDGQTRWRSRPSALIEEHIPETGKVKMSAQAESIADSYYRVTLNGLGEGQVNVCGEGGDIEVGDLLETSTIAGKARKQTDNVYRASTLGKAREEVTFASATEVKMIACSYHSS